MPSKSPQVISKNFFYVSDSTPQPFKVKLSVPEPNEECPLSLCPIQEDMLEWLPNITFSKKHTAFKKMTLSCDHSFGAMTLLYHFARNSLQCPLCRKGNFGRLDIKCVPVHFRRAFQKRIKSSDTEAEQEAAEEDAQVAANLFLDYVRNLDNMISNVYLTVCAISDSEVVEFFEIRMMFVARAVIQNNLHEYDTFHFTLMPPARRAVVSNLEDLNMNRIVCRLYIQVPGTARRLLSESVFFDVRSTQEFRNIHCTHGSMNLTTFPALDNGMFRSLNWNVPANHLIQ